MRATFLVLIACGVFAAGPLHADTFEPNDSIGQAYGPLASGVTVESMISSDGDQDWYTIDAAAGALTITLTGIPSGTDYDMCLTDQGGNILAPCSDAEGNADERIDYLVTGPGRFWIHVFAPSGFSITIAYRLTATFVTIVNPPVVALVSPNGGESWTGGTSHTVQWTAEDIEDGTALAIDLAWSADGGAAWSPLAAGLANTGSWAWTIPDIPTGHARVRVTARDSGGAAGADSSDADFAIVASQGNATLALARNVAGTAGSIVSVPLMLTNDRAVEDIETQIGFDPLRLTFLDAGVGLRAASLSLTATPQDDGHVHLALSGAPGASIAAGTGEIAVLRFRVDHFAAAGDTAALLPTAAAAHDAGGVPMLLATSSGLVTVSEGLAAEVALSIPSGLAVDVGLPLAVPVTLSANVPLSRLEFTLQYPPDLLFMLLVTAGPASSGFTMESSSLGSGALRLVFTSAPGTAAGPDSGVVCTVAFSPALNPTHNATLDFSETLARGPRDEVVAVTATGAEVVPVKLLALAVDDEPTGARVRWQVADASIAAGYRVLRAGVGDAEPVHEGLLPATTTEFVDDTAVPGERYRYWVEALGRDGSLSTFGPVEITLAPRGLWAGLPYPNPARSGASVDLRAFAPGEVRACVTDVTGRVVRELAGSTGASILHWDGRTEAGTEAPAGIYFLVVTQGAERELRRIVKLGG
jgi:hypothetical protein